MSNPFPVRDIRTPRSRPKRTDSGWVQLGPSAGAQARALGHDPSATDGPPRSALRRQLGPSRFVNVPARRVIWADCDALRQTGLFDVPEDNKLTPKLEQKIVDALSYRVLSPGEAFLP